MRIIRVLVALITILVIILPQIAFANAKTNDSNETKINFKMEDSLIIKNGFIRAKYQLFASTPEGFSEKSEAKTDREKEIEKVMSRFESKRKAVSYPQGKFTVNASAYTAAADECGKSDGITASGLKVQKNETIACPPHLPLGTKLAIEGMGTFICEDRGGAIKGNHIDIYMETKSEAFAFGRKNLVAEVVM